MTIGMSRDDETDIRPVRLTPEQEARRRRRNVVIALLLVGMVALFFAMTLVRLGGNVTDRAL